jgi:RHS repeat-associated protein
MKRTDIISSCYHYFFLFVLLAGFIHELSAENNYRNAGRISTVHYKLEKVGHSADTVKNNKPGEINLVTADAPCAVSTEGFTLISNFYSNHNPATAINNDDGYVVLDLPNFLFHFYGKDYSKVYINVNGKISFDLPHTTPESTDPLYKTTNPVISAFWADIDISKGGKVYYKLENDRLIVLWKDVVSWVSATSSTGEVLKNTFQIVLTGNGSTFLGGGNNVGIFYSSMQWASSYADGFGGNSSKCGIALGDGFYEQKIGEFSQLGSSFNIDANNNGIGYLNGKCYSFKTYNSITATPSACNSTNNKFSLSGNIIAGNSFSGTLTVTDNVSGKSVSYASYTNPISYTISDIPSDGVTHTVSAVFSGNPSQPVSITFTAPPVCFCAYLSSVKITQSYPLNLKVLGSSDSKRLQYAISPIPAATTHQVTIQVLQEKFSPEGIIVPDFGTTYQVIKNYNSTTPLTTATTTVNFTDFTGMPAAGSFYWRIGYSNSSVTTTQWSDVMKFTIAVPEVAIPLETYVKNNTQHTNQINWVYETTFFENNQTMQSMVYMDGLANVRQTQVLANSVKSGTLDGNVLCKEYVYSENGGSPVQSLSSPLHVNKFKYEYRFFDVGSGTSLRDFSTEDFDMDAISAGAKDRITPTAIEKSASNTKGVGFYYSNLSTFDGSLVDDAEGYPYSYSVSRKNPSADAQYISGLGKDFRITSGRETEIVESKAAPEELEKVFGKNAPPADNIVKTTVYDANGVGSISYTDNEGKVIATALTACRSENLQTLNEPGATPITTVTDVLKNENSSLNDVSKTARGKFEISCYNGTATLDYSLDLKTFPGYDSQCKACKYNIDIKVIEDKTGRVVYPTGGASSVQTIGASDATCGYSSNGYKILDSVQITNLNPGIYTVVRSISPAFETAAGVTESYLETIEEEYIEHIETHRDQYYNDYEAEINPDKYYLLRKIETGINRNTTDCSEIAATATLSVAPKPEDDFSPELIKNGNFEDAEGGGWYICYGNRSGDAYPTEIVPHSFRITNNLPNYYGEGDIRTEKPVFISGRIYKLELDVELGVGSTLGIHIGGGYFGGHYSAQTINTSGHHVVILNIPLDYSYPGYGLYIHFNSIDATIDNISLKEVKSSPCGIATSPNLVTNDEFGKNTKGWYNQSGTEITFTENSFNLHPTYSGVSAYPLASTVAGKKYQLQFDIISLQGYSNLQVTEGSVSKTFNTAGRKTFEFTASSGSKVKFSLNGKAASAPYSGVIDNVSIREIKPCSLKVYQDGTAITNAIPYNTTDIQTATDLVTALGTTNANFTFSNMSGQSPRITVKGKTGVGSSGNGAKFELRASSDGTNYNIVLDDDITAGGMNNGACKERIWYVDEITLKDLDPVVISGNTTYTKQITDAAGDVNGNGIEGDENYYLTGALYDPFEADSRAAATANYRRIFIDTYEKQHWYRYPESDFTTFEVYIAPTGSELVYTIPVLAEDKKLKSTYDEYKIIKVKAKQPPCDAICLPRNDDSECDVNCGEMQKYYDADVTRTKTAIDNFTAAHPGKSFNGKTLSAIITGTDYPNISRDTRNAVYNDTDYPVAKQLFMEYDVAYRAKAAFNIEDCKAACLNPGPGACGTCDVDYYHCIKDNFDELVKGHAFINDAPDPAQPAPDPNDPDPNRPLGWDYGQPFPVTKSMLVQNGEVNSDMLNNLGSILYNHLITVLPESGTVNWTKEQWENYVTLTTTNCPNCLSPGTNGCTKKEFSGSDISQQLLDIFKTSNDACLAPYNECIKKSAPGNLGNEQCQEDIDMCNLTQEEFLAHPRYVNIGSDPCYQKLSINGTCMTRDQYNADCDITFSCASHMKQQKLNVIDEMTRKIYSSPGEAKAKAAEIFKEYEFRPIQELTMYLLKLEDFESCRQSCEKGREHSFLKWYELKKEKAGQTIRENYFNTCFGGASEKFTVTTTKDLYHFTLYNFNKANDLVGTVPPEGVDYVDKTKDPVHRLGTVYMQNSVGELQSSTTPDGGTTKYLYDKAGRIRFSQNAEQSNRLPGYVIFSYTKYDNSGRMIETGECRHKTNPQLYGEIKGFIRPGSAPVQFVSDYINDNSFPGVASENFEVTTFRYDARDMVNGVQQGPYQHGRVSSVRNENANTYYNYDAHGRVNWVVQEITAMGTSGFKKMDYEYEPVSSKLIKMHYQKDVPGEQLSHAYEYDGDNRLKVVKISRNGTDWYTAAVYDYYMHGPLKNVVYGESVQKIDYVYNIQGWLKAINNPFQLSDGTNPKDVFAEVLHYYSGYKDGSGTYQTVGDYKRTGKGFAVSDVSGTYKTTPQESSTGTNTWMRNSGDKKVYDLYNGNISSIVSSTGFALAGQAGTNNLMLQGFRYDALNRLVESFTETHNTITASFTGFKPTAQVEGTNNYYREKMTYDASGNIMSLKRTGGPSGSPAMDNMSYTYAQDVNGNKINNKLLHVTDTDGDIAVVEDIVGRTPACTQTPVPAASKWLIRNTRNDQNNGAGFTNETGVLLFTQPAGNLNTAWLIDQEKPVKLESGKTYTITYEFLGDATAITKMKVGLASSAGATAPVLLTGTSEITTGFSSTYYKTHRFTVTATGSGTAYLAMELTWSGTAATPSLVTSAVKNRLKNINICAPGVTIGVIAATDYSLGNTSSDQTSGSSLAADGDELKVTHKATGMNYIWLMDKTTMTVKKGEAYTITAEVKDLDAVKTTSIVMNLATAISATGPTLLPGQPDVTISRTYNGSGFTKVTFSFVAEADATVYPVFKLNYTTSPSQVTYTWFRKFTREGYGINNCNGNNFTYDAKGRLIADCENEIALIRWTSFNKVAEVIRTSGSIKPNLKFSYDGLQMKIKKEIIFPSNPGNNSTTYYVLNSSFMLVASYVQVNSSFQLQEQSLYGISKFGAIDRAEVGTGTELQIIAGSVRFQLNDHQGNIRAVVSGTKNQAGDANIHLLSDYYSFGSLMPGRSYFSASSNIKYGYQGQEKLNEIDGEGNFLNFAFRIQDARLGRFLSIDPLERKYPGNSPYAFSENNVVASVELEGLERWEINSETKTANGEISTCKYEVYGPYKDFETAKAAARSDKTGTLVWGVFPEIKMSQLRKDYGDLKAWFKRNAIDYEIYHSGVIKGTYELSESWKAVVPWHGYQIGYSSRDGGYGQKINFTNFYLNYKYSKKIDIRFRPFGVNDPTRPMGDWDPQFRALYTVCDGHIKIPVPYIGNVPVGKWKFQLDGSTDPFAVVHDLINGNFDETEISLGIRVVGETWAIPIQGHDYNAEGVVGGRLIINLKALFGD